MDLESHIELDVEDNKFIREGNLSTRTSTSNYNTNPNTCNRTALDL